MSEPEIAWLIQPLVAFCRIGSCLMLLPGFASDRVPIRFRLIVALSLALATSGLVHDQITAALMAAGLEATVAAEACKGIAIGVLVRVVFSAPAFAGSLIATFAGLQSTGQSSLNDNEAAPALADLLSLGALVLFITSNLHVVLIEVILASYDTLPPAQMLPSGDWLSIVTVAASTASLLAVQVAAPLLVLSFLANFILGVANRLVPMLPVQFIGGPILALAGIAVSYWTIDEAMIELVLAFETWLRKGT